MAKTGLQRQLNPIHVWALAFGCIIGWGSFINPGKKFLFNSGVAGTAIAMLIGAIIMIIIAFNYAYMFPSFQKPAASLPSRKSASENSPRTFAAGSWWRRI